MLLTQLMEHSKALQAKDRRGALSRQQAPAVRTADTTALRNKRSAVYEEPVTPAGYAALILTAMTSVLGGPISDQAAQQPFPAWHPVQQPQIQPNDTVVDDGTLICDKSCFFTKQDLWADMLIVCFQSLNNNTASLSVSFFWGRESYSLQRCNEKNHKCSNAKAIHNGSCRLPAQLDCTQTLRFAESHLVKQNKQQTRQLFTSQEPSLFLFTKQRIINV